MNAIDASNIRNARKVDTFPLNLSRRDGLVTISSIIGLGKLILSVN
jgi:hypothetical protein